MGVKSAGLGHGCTFFFELPLYGSHCRGALASENAAALRARKSPSVQELNNLAFSSMLKPVLFRKSATIFATHDDDGRDADGRKEDDDIFHNEIAAQHAMNHAGNAAKRGSQESIFACMEFSETRSESSGTGNIVSQSNIFPLSELQPTSLTRILLVVLNIFFSFIISY